MFDKKNLFYYVLLLLAFLIGLFFRVKLYLINNDIHCDEASLALNIIDISYLDAFKPLMRHQVAPPMFIIFSKFIYSFIRFHQTPDFSDLLLRLISLLSGILAMPLFAYLINKLFHNKLMTLFGLFFLAVNPVAISYSCVFKQYSMEMLISILVLILFAKIDFKLKSFTYNLLIFLLLGISSLFSMTALFIMPGGFIYVFIKALKQEHLKDFFIAFFLFVCLFILYTISYLLPVYSTHSEYMKDYWSNTFSAATNIWRYIYNSVRFLFRIFIPYKPITIAVLFIINTLLMFIKDFKTAILISSTFFVTFILSINNSYPVDERLLLFILPCYIISITYFLTFIPEKYVFKYKNIVCVFFLALSYYSWKTHPSDTLIILKQEATKRIWNYYINNCDQDIPLFLGRSPNSNAYYAKLYNHSNWKSWKNIVEAPSGVYYLLITKARNDKNIIQTANFLQETPQIKIIEDKEFCVYSVYDYGCGHLYKFRKLY